MRILTKVRLIKLLLVIPILLIFFIYCEDSQTTFVNLECDNDFDKANLNKFIVEHNEYVNLNTFSGLENDIAYQNSSVYIAYINDVNGQKILKFAKSTDNGENWDSFSIIDPDVYNARNIRISVFNDIIYILYYDLHPNSIKLAVSINGGTRWSTFTIEENENLGISNDLFIYNDIIYVTYQYLNDSFKFAKSTDIGKNWSIKLIDNNYYSGWYPSMFVENNNIYIAYCDYYNSSLKFAKSTDNGESFVTQFIDESDSIGFKTSICKKDTVLYVAYFDRYNNAIKISKSEDDGSTWSIANSKISYNKIETIFGDININTENNDLFLSYITKKKDDYTYLVFFKSMDNGTTWYIVNEIKDASRSSVIYTKNLFYILYSSSQGLLFSVGNIYDNEISEQDSVEISHNENIQVKIGEYSSVYAEDGIVYISYYDSTNRSIKFIKSDNRGENFSAYKIIFGDQNISSFKNANTIADKYSYITMYNDVIYILFYELGKTSNENEDEIILRLAKSYDYGNSFEISEILRGLETATKYLKLLISDTKMILIFGNEIYYYTGAESIKKRRFNFLYSNDTGANWQYFDKLGDLHSNYLDSSSDVDFTGFPSMIIDYRGYLYLGYSNNGVKLSRSKDFGNSWDTLKITDEDSLTNSLVSLNNKIFYSYTLRKATSETDTLANYEMFLSTIDDKDGFDYHLKTSIFEEYSIYNIDTELYLNHYRVQNIFHTPAKKVRISNIDENGKNCLITSFYLDGENFSISPDYSGKYNDVYISYYYDHSLYLGRVGY